MEKLTKQDILDMLYKKAEDSWILDKKTRDGYWSVNELIYALNLIQASEDIRFSIQIENLGIGVPVELHVPVFVPTATRGFQVKIEDIEVEEVEYDEYEKDYIYLIIVEQKYI